MFNIYRMLFLVLKKLPMIKITPQQNLTIQWKEKPNQIYPKFLGGNGRGNIMECFTFPSWDVGIISTYFQVWLWTVTQTNTTRNEMFLKVLLIIGNRFLISMWKYWIWISMNEIILRTTALKWLLITILSKIECGQVTLLQVEKYWLVYWINVREWPEYNHTQFLKANQQWTEMI